MASGIPERLYRGESTELHLERRNSGYTLGREEWKSTGGWKKTKPYAKAQSVKGHVKVEDTVQDQQEMSQQTQS